MSPTIRSAIILLLVSWCCSVGCSAARACVFLPVVSTSPIDPVRDQWARRRNLKIKNKQFRKDVASGKIDSADGLADLLIPNLREWKGGGNDCSGPPPVDGPVMTQEDMLAAAMVGTELEGMNKDDLYFVSAGFVRRDLQAYNEACNEEFRAVFATQLRQSVSRRARDRAYFHLSWLGTRRGRYFQFPDVQRAALPVLADEGSIQLPLESTDPVNRALNRFWVQALPRLREPNSSCPEAHRKFLAAREIYLHRLRESNWYSRFMKPKNDKGTPHTVGGPL